MEDERRKYKKEEDNFEQEVILLRRNPSKKIEYENVRGMSQ